MDGTFNTAAAHSRGAGAASFPANGMLPDIGLGTNQNQLFAERPMGVDVSQNAQNPVEAAPAIDEVVGEPDGNVDVQPPRVEEEAVRGELREEERVREEGGNQEAAPAVEAVISGEEQNRLQRVKFSLSLCVSVSLSLSLSLFLSLSLSLSHRLVGLVVKASASSAGGPGFESRLRRDFFGVESYQ